MDAAARAGLQVIGLTDHDTTAGWVPASEHRPPGLVLVPGVEFSCVYRGADGRRISLHLLAYLVDPDDQALRAEWARLRQARRERARDMVERLAADGFAITWAQVDALAAGGSVGRPHIGRALVMAGVVPDVSAAFADLLSSKRPYYIAKPDTDVFTALRLVREAGGITVFAHPLARRRGPVVGDDVIAAMAGAGLHGLEVDHPDHDPRDRAHEAKLAADLGLLGTGSSDYHGTNKPQRLGERTTDPAVYDMLLALPAARAPIGP